MRKLLVVLLWLAVCTMAVPTPLYATTTDPADLTAWLSWTQGCYSIAADDFYIDSDRTDQGMISRVVFLYFPNYLPSDFTISFYSSTGFGTDELPEDLLHETTVSFDYEVVGYGGPYGDDPIAEVTAELDDPFEFSNNVQYWWSMDMDWTEECYAFGAIFYETILHDSPASIMFYDQWQRLVGGEGGEDTFGLMFELYGAYPSIVPPNGVGSTDECDDTVGMLKDNGGGNTAPLPSPSFIEPASWGQIKAL